ncbi:hypothetical protein J2S53_004239 [Actinopolyspora lacussalsi]|nr:hypothetical protein [Actinopolyspora lacussalsi]
MRIKHSAIGSLLSIFIFMLLSAPTASAEKIGTYNCDIPSKGAQYCTTITVHIKQSVQIYLHEAEDPVGFCLRLTANDSEVGDCKLLSAGQMSRALWTNPGTGAKKVKIYGNADSWAFTTHAKFSVHLV